MDWSLGRYERMAEQLLPAARVAIERGAPDRGERVLDVGCGTGNAALLAAVRGARVTGVDPAERLLEVARADAAARRLEADFIRGEAAALPVADRSADLVVSVFGVIFAPDPGVAADEIARVTAPHGRVVLCAWMPSGALFEIMRLRREATGTQADPSAGRPPFSWHDRLALEDRFAPGGFVIECYEESLAFVAPSAREFADAEFRDHPLWIAARQVLEPRGEVERLRERAIEILVAANEDPTGFRVSSRYIVTVLRRS